MPRSARTRQVSAAQVRAYARKAQEFADAAAASELDAERHIAATSLAIHATTEVHMTKRDTLTTWHTRYPSGSMNRR